MVLVAIRPYAEGEALCETSHSLPEGRSPAQGAQESKKSKKAVQKGEKQEETSRVLFIKNKPIITSKEHEVKLLKSMLVTLAELILLFDKDLILRP